MTQYLVTVDAEVVHQVLWRDDGLVRVVLDQILDAPVTDPLQAGRYERTSERLGERNGTRPRPVTTRVGTVELQVPQVRDGTFSTKVFAR